MSLTEKMLNAFYEKYAKYWCCFCHKEIKGKNVYYTDVSGYGHYSHCHHKCKRIHKTICKEV